MSEVEKSNHSGEHEIPRVPGEPTLNETNGDLGLPLAAVLSDKKIRAAELITTGLKYIQVAEQTDISVEQLWRWRQQPEFQRFLSRLRLDRHQARVNRIWSLGDIALDVVGESLQEGDPQTAMQLLKLLGPGLTDTTESPASSTPSEDVAQPADLECGTCGMSTRSQAGMKRHVKARHGKDDEKDSSGHDGS